MSTQTPTLQLEESPKGRVLIPLIRAAATIGFAIAPCSLGFVIIAVSEHLIRSIMVGDDPEMLMSDLQNQFPNDAFEIIENDDAPLIAQVVDLIERREQALELPVDIRGTDLQLRVWDALMTVPAGTTMNYTFFLGADRRTRGGKKWQRHIGSRFIRKLLIPVSSPPMGNWRDLPLKRAAVAFWREEYQSRCTTRAEWSAPY